MIQLPPNSTTAAGSKVTEPSATAIDSVKVAASEAIKATVIEAKAISKETYEILLKISPQTTASTASSIAPKSPVTEITPSLIQQLKLGNSFLVKTHSPFPLPVDAQLTASISPAKGIVIQTIQSPAQTIVANAVQQLIPKQMALNELLSNLIQLTNQTRQLRSLPQPLQETIGKLLATLPRPEALKTAESLKSTINSSGLFRESQIREMSGETSSAKPNSRIIESLRQLSQKLWQPEAGAKQPGNQQPSVDAEPIQNAKKTDASPILRDIKQQLQNLQQAIESNPVKLQQATNQSASNASPINSPVAPTGSEKPNLNIPVNDPIQRNAATNAGKKAVDGLTLKPNENLGTIPQPQKSDKELAALAKTSQSKMQAYMSNTPLATDSKTDPVSRQLFNFVLPPLPGAVQIQAQPRVKPSLSGNEMADALTSVLLKQVKGALARITLHQLASTASQRDTTNSPLQLSFEIPVLHGGEASVFQFLIEEQTSDKQQNKEAAEKRWMVQMGFDIEGLGPMLCQINLWGSNTSVSFWAEWEQTLEFTKQHFDYLEDVLQDMGLKVNKIEGHLGIPKVDKTLLSQQLVDIKT